MANVNFMIESSKSDLSSKARLVLNCLSLHCRKDNDSCFPSLNTIGKEAGISRSTVIRAIKELVEVNIVKKVARFSDKKNGGQTSNLYFLNLNFNAEKETKQTDAEKEEPKKEELKVEKIEPIVEVQENNVNVQKRETFESVPADHVEEVVEEKMVTSKRKTNYKSEDNKEVFTCDFIEKLKSKLKFDKSLWNLTGFKENVSNCKMPILKGLKWGRVSE